MAMNVDPRMEIRIYLDVDSRLDLVILDKIITISDPRFRLSAVYL